MENIWKSVLDFFTKASADLALKIVVAAVLLFVGVKDTDGVAVSDGDDISGQRIRLGDQRQGGQQEQSES